MTPQDHEEQAARMLSEANRHEERGGEEDSDDIAAICYESAAMHLSAANDLARAHERERVMSEVLSAVAAAPCGRGEVLWSSTGSKCARAPQPCNCWKRTILDRARNQCQKLTADGRAALAEQEGGNDASR